MHSAQRPDTPVSGRSLRRWRAAALLAVGIAIGVAVTATPVSGHVGTRVAHLWNAHIKPKTDARYYTKAQANGRYAGKGAKAPDADLIDGLDSTELLQGEGRALSSTSTLAHGSFATVLSVEDVVNLTWFCPPTADGSTLIAFNDSGDPLNLFVEIGGFAPFYLSVASGASSGEMQTLRNEDVIRLQVGSTAVGVVTIELAVARRASDCLVQVQGVQTT
jgi:hypothetical protein